MITTGFPALDKLTGGVRERQAYLLHGNAKEAKTALALAFLTQGANDGRPVALVTDRRADAVFEESARLGLDPVTALLLAPNVEAAADRFRTMASSFSELGATAFYLLHTPGGSE